MPRIFDADTLATAVYSAGDGVCAVVVAVVVSLAVTSGAGAGAATGVGAGTDTGATTGAMLVILCPPWRQCFPPFDSNKLVSILQSYHNLIKAV